MKLPPIIKTATTKLPDISYGFYAGLASAGWFATRLMSVVILRKSLLFESENDITGLFLSWFSIIHTFVNEWRDFRYINRWIAFADKLITDYPGFFPEY